MQSGGWRCFPSTWKYSLIRTSRCSHTTFAQRVPILAWNVTPGHGWLHTHCCMHVSIYCAPSHRHTCGKEKLFRFKSFCDKKTRETAYKLSQLERPEESSYQASCHARLNPFCHGFPFFLPRHPTRSGHEGLRLAVLSGCNFQCNPCGFGLSFFSGRRARTGCLAIHLPFFRFAFSFPLDGCMQALVGSSGGHWTKTDWWGFCGWCWSFMRQKKGMRMKREQ